MMRRECPVFPAPEDQHNLPVQFGFLRDDGLVQRMGTWRHGSAERGGLRVREAELPFLRRRPHETDRLEQYRKPA